VAPVVFGLTSCVALSKAFPSLRVNGLPPPKFQNLPPATALPGTLFGVGRLAFCVQAFVAML
jgi:hypothetical protein